MVKRTAVLAGVGLLALFAGCGGSDRDEADLDSFSGGLAIQRLGSGEECAYDEMKMDFAVRGTDGSYKSVWKKLFGASAPSADLNGKVVLLALRGQQPKSGNDIRIVGADAKGETMEIQVKLLKASGLSSRKVCSPYDVVVVEKPEGVMTYRFVDADTGKLLEETEAL